MNKLLSKRLLLQALFLLLTIAYYYWLSLPGLDGGFILDDWPNLDKLSKVKTTPGIWAYTFSGLTGNPGRPLSYLSFALQAEHWPNNPTPFKQINLFIHIVNALLVYLSCSLLARLLTWPALLQQIFSATVFCLWLFMPLHMSTIFYVVQRMTLLSALFSLIGVLGFLWGLLLAKKHSLTGVFIATGAMGIAYIAGILCKENAILTGLYISTLYFVLLRDQHKSILWDRWTMICGLLPPIIVFAYLFFSGRYLAGYVLRDFNLQERLLTESIIVWDYVGRIFLPSPGELNLFNDDVTVSRGLLHPPQTLLACMAWLFTGFFAITLRKKVPFFSFAILWFLAGHTLESTFMGLELSFEHRNYLPSLGLWIGLTGFIVNRWHRFDFQYSPIPRVNLALAIIPIALLFWSIVISSLEIKTWQSPKAMVYSSLQDRPNSMRARQEALAFLINTNDFPRAAYLMATFEQKWPGWTSNYAQPLVLKCLDNNVIAPDINSIHTRFLNGPFDRATVDAMFLVLDFKKDNFCQFINLDDYRKLIKALLSNPNFNPLKKNLVLLIAFSYKVENNLKQSAKSFEMYPEAQADADFMLQKAQFNAMAENYHYALTILDRVRQRYQKNIKVWFGIKNHVAFLQNRINQKIKKEQ